MPLWGCDAPGGFLLKHVEDIERAFQADGVDSAIGVAVEMIANLKDAATESLEGFGAGRMIAKLRFEQSLPNLSPDRRRKRL